MAKVDLEFLARQLERVITDLAILKDDAMVVMARLDRIDATVQSLVVGSSASRSEPNRTGNWFIAGPDPPDLMRKGS
jgi:hypothetical protein